MILALAMAAHWVAWPPDIVQMGVSIGTGSDEHLIAMVPADGCASGMKVYSGRYGDFDKAMEFIVTSDICKRVEQNKSSRLSWDGKAQR